MKLMITFYLAVFCSQIISISDDFPQFVESRSKSKQSADKFLEITKPKGVAIHKRSLATSCSHFFTKVTAVIRGGLGFTKEVVGGIIQCKSKEEYIPMGFSKFMDALFLNPKLKVPMVRQLEQAYSDPIKPIMNMLYRTETIQLGEPFESTKRGNEFPLLEKKFLFPDDIDFSHQKEFIQRCYLDQMPSERDFRTQNSRYFPKMHIYRLKENDTGKYLIYYSGGAFLLNHYTIFTQFPRYYADYNLVFVQYGLAPEYPYPQGILDAIDAYHIIINRYSPKSVVLVGDSAGGHLGLQVAIYVKSHYRAASSSQDDVTTFQQQPNCLILLSPWTDMSLAGASVSENSENDSIKPRFGLHKFRELYLGMAIESSPLTCWDYADTSVPMQILTDLDLKRPQFSPVFRDLHGLPPILVQTGDHEILRSDNEQLVETLSNANNDYEHSVFPFQVHMFQTFPFLTTTRNSLSQGRSFVDRHTEISK